GSPYLPVDQHRALRHAQGRIALSPRRIQQGCYSPSRAYGCAAGRGHGIGPEQAQEDRQQHRIPAQHERGIKISLFVLSVTREAVAASIPNSPHLKVLYALGVAIS